MNKNFKIKVTGNWCEYQPEKHIDLSQIISFVCWTDQIGGPYRFQLKTGDTFYIERYEIGKQIEDALKAQQTEVSKLQKRVVQLEVSEFTLAKVKLILKNNPNLIESELKKLIERALNADQYISHRQKAEEAIVNGASLTKHKVDL